MLVTDDAVDPCLLTAYLIKTPFSMLLQYVTKLQPKASQLWISGWC